MLLLLPRAGKMPRRMMRRRHVATRRSLAENAQIHFLVAFCLFVGASELKINRITGN